jgi:sugar fermentation stimulation protein A
VDTLVDGLLIGRANRFAADVSVAGVPARAHLPNSGRMRELLVSGAPVRLRPEPGPARRTPYDLVQVFAFRRWVGLDARTPPAVAIEAQRAGLLVGLEGYPTVRREVGLGASRIDLRFEGPEGVCWAECKSANLVEEGLALFPDAPTARGARHLRELAGALAPGVRSAVVFVVQRDDATALAPFTEADPAFAAALAEAVAVGVEPYAVTCSVDGAGLHPLRSIPVLAEQGRVGVGK